MYKRNLFFGSLAFLGITLLILTGCPNVIDDGTDKLPGPSQEDLTVTATANSANGDTALWIQLSKGSFAASVTAGTFEIKTDGYEDTNFRPGATPVLKISPDRKILTITGGGADASPVSEAKKITVRIPKEALTGEVVSATDVTVGTVDQGNVDIPQPATSTNAAKGNNAIEVSLSKGSFASEVTTGAYFTHFPNDSAIETHVGSDVTVSADGRKATIYGLTAAAGTGPIKIGVKQSALVGYPTVQTADVSFAATTLTNAPSIITLATTPANNDNYITITLGDAHTFATTPSISNFTLIHPATSPNGIAIGTGTLVVNTAKTKAVITVGTPADNVSSSFRLKIAKTAFTTSGTIAASNITVATTQQEDVDDKESALSTGTNTHIRIVIANGGKFAAEPSLVIGHFTNTMGNDPIDSSATISGGFFTRVSDTEVTIDLGVDFAAMDKKIVVDIDAAAFAVGWPVTADDITITPYTPSP
ncbi:MAG: hypothetical protein LBG08_01410 [Spirochaetaceae bacterium]|jgi:hypothetical protein|nr:hypothetical protein [Spirochaetaceae bacterium]